MPFYGALKIRPWMITCNSKNELKFSTCRMTVIKYITFAYLTAFDEIQTQNNAKFMHQTEVQDYIEFNLTFTVF
jgi:hypothetical protein